MANTTRLLIKYALKAKISFDGIQKIDGNYSRRYYKSGDRIESDTGAPVLFDNIDAAVKSQDKFGKDYVDIICINEA